MLRTILLLTASNIFMTFAWYGHLKSTGMPLWKAVAISWGIAFFEFSPKETKEVKPQSFS